ncbi:hypothetical protein ACX93W_10990 [Paenibacillus sp. CAU 1782]
MYDKLVIRNDDWALEGLKRQVQEEGLFFGGVTEPATGLPSPSHLGTAMHLAIWATAIVNPDSSLYRSKELLAGMERGIEYMLASQHEDGTISPPWTNMHSPPDTGFVIGGLAQVHELLAREDWPPLAAATSQLRLFLERTVPAMLSGGCHTPNHRWILTAALGFLHKLTGREELRERALQWLAEGLDCTEDGEWTERSNGIYNAVSDIALIYTAEQLEMPELLEPVRRNLRMMSYLLHPDGEVVTDYSGRQDFGVKHHFGPYFLAARWLAEHDGDPLFAAMSELAGELLDHPGGLPNNVLVGLLRLPGLKDLTVTPAPLPEVYRVVLNKDFDREHYLSGMEKAGHGGVIYHSRLHPEFGAPVARIRDGATSATVMTEGTSFFALRHGAARLLAVQAASSFGPGFVKMGTLEEGGSGYTLRASEKKGYYGPVAGEHLPDSSSGRISPWYLFPHQLRPVTHEQTHLVEAVVDETETGWTIRIACGKSEPMLTQLSLVFDGGGILGGEGLEPAGPSSRLWASGIVRYSMGDDWIQLEGASKRHAAIALNNVSYPSGCQTLVVNLLTPYDHTIHIRLSGKGAGKEGEAQ